MVHAPESEFDNYSLSYSALVVPLVQAVQEQQVMIDEKDKEIQQLQQQLLSFQDRLARIEALLDISVEAGAQILWPETQSVEVSGSNNIEIKSYPLPSRRPSAEISSIPEYGTRKAKDDSQH